MGRRSPITSGAAQQLLVRPLELRANEVLQLLHGNDQLQRLGFRDRIEALVRHIVARGSTGVEKLSQFARPLPKDQRKRGNGSIVLLVTGGAIPCSREDEGAKGGAPRCKR